jgi:hypothetical protein
VVFRGQQGADIALKHEVRTVGALAGDKSGNLRMDSRVDTLDLPNSLNSYRLIHSVR